MTWIWVVTAVLVLAQYGFNAFNAQRCRRTASRLCGEVRSHRDLQLVRSAIDTSMTLAAILIVIFATYLLGVLLSVALTPIRLDQVWVPLLIFGVGSAPAALLARPAEERIRSLRITAVDPTVEATYQRWLAQWKQARLRLPD